MFRLRMILIVVLFPLGFLPCVVSGQQAPALEKATLTDMVIEGETNVNTFHLFLENSRTGNAPEPVSGLYAENSILFRIPLHLLDCKNDKLLADFYDLVRADEYPEVLIRIDLQDFNRLITENHNTPASLYLTLAGVTRKIKTNSSYIQHMSDEKVPTRSLVATSMTATCRRPTPFVSKSSSITSTMAMRRRTIPSSASLAK